MLGFCVRCKSKQTISQPKEKTTSNGRKMITGACLKCATKINVFVSSKS